MDKETQYLLEVKTEESVVRTSDTLRVCLTVRFDLTRPQLEGDMIPFAYLEDTPDMHRTQSGLAEHRYETTVADNKIVRAIIEILQNEKDLRCASGNRDWREYRAELVAILLEKLVD